MYRFFASCPKGTEDLLATELRQMGREITRTTTTGLHFEGNLASGYQACLWSRVANRILVELSEPNQPTIESAEDLYDQAFNVPWEEHFANDNSFSVDFIGTNRCINNSAFGAVKVKDAIVDRFRQHTGARPDVSKESPDIRVVVHLFRDKAAISLDLSGESLGKRGYRIDKGIAPLKENLAAAMLMRAGWPALVAEQGTELIDPMCGSGTFLIEAAWMQLHIAPNLLRREWGFDSWLHHDEAVWEKIFEEAEQKRQHNLEGDASDSAGACIYGFDVDANVIKAAKKNIQAAGLAYKIIVAQGDVSTLTPPGKASKGLLICNPPYGERMGERDQLASLYLSLSETAKAQFPGWILAVLSGDQDLLREMRLRARKRNVFFNGPIESELWIADLVSREKARLRSDDKLSELKLDEGAEMVYNRLQKNQKRLQSWINKNAVQCYRLYDADMPEYAAAIDVYGGQPYIQEYAPPKKIDSAAANRRLRALTLATAKFFDNPPNSIPVKTRMQQKGKSQYERVDRSDAFSTVQEGKAKLRVNLKDFLDTGLFLDHRPLRQRIAEQARGKRFLNLFCYTATATVHAALAGAESSVSVDMSKTYLDWALENFELNHVSNKRHTLVQQDCLAWLKQCREGFDLIMLDPPSFSNSKRMTGVLDVQKDHASMITRCMDLLNPGGTLYFSTNLRKFKLDVESLEKWQVKDISSETIDPDFARNPKIHQCFEITHG